jgi:hypothetical protein
VEIMRDGAPEAQRFVAPDFVCVLRAEDDSVPVFGCDFKGRPLWEDGMVSC